MRHVVTVARERRTTGDRWITEGTDIFGPFYTPATAREFARKVATGARRKKFSMGMMQDPVLDGGSWVLDNFSSRTVVTATAIRPSSTRSAWASIRAHFNDRRIR